MLLINNVILNKYSTDVYHVHISAGIYIYVCVHYIHNIYTFLSGMVNTLVNNLDVKKLGMSQMDYFVTVNPLNYQYLDYWVFLKQNILL